MADQVDYIRGPSQLIGAPPFKTDGAIMHGMFIRGERKTLQAVCDALINDASEGGLSYRVLSPYVMFAALYAARTYSLHPNDVKRGAVRERDLGFWLLVLGRKKGELLPTRLAWLPVFLFVDSATAMASGREMFGYPKDLGRIDRSSDLKGDPCVKISVEHLERFGEEKTAEWGDLVSVVAREDAAPAAIGDEPDIAIQPHIFDFLVDDEALESMKPASKEAERTRLRATFSLPKLGLPTILLKQFPTTDIANKAVHRSIACVTPRANVVRSMKFLRGAYSVKIAPSDSHPIARELGLHSENAARLPFCVDMDFIVPAGETLWPAP